VVRIINQLLPYEHRDTHGHNIEQDVGRRQVAADFLRHLFRLALSFRGKFNFLNMERQGCYNELTYRQNFERSFNWLAFNFELIMAYTLPERIVVFDPSYLSKSGKHTPGVGWHWSGCSGAPKWGLEIGAFSVVDVVNHTATAFGCRTNACRRRPNNSGSLLEYYGDRLVLEKAADTCSKSASFWWRCLFFP
jgi:hypothetical protein